VQYLLGKGAVSLTELPEIAGLERSAGREDGVMAENSQETAKRKCGGRPFRAGMSGNPGGRPKVIAEVRDLARQHTRKAIGTLVKVMQSGESDSPELAAALAFVRKGDTLVVWKQPTSCSRLPHQQ
jgi:hypothetical protein